MSFTTTITQPQALISPAVEAPLTLYLHIETIKQKATALVEKMIRSTLFSSAMSETMRRWVERFHSYPLSTVQEKERAAQSLCFLLCQCVRPAFLQERGEDELLEFEEELTKLLLPLLPIGKTSEAFIAEFEVYCDKQRVIEGHLKTIKEDLHQRIHYLYTKANSINQEELRQFETLKQKLKALVISRQAAASGSKRELDALVIQVDQLFTSLQKNLSTHCSEAEKMKSHEDALKNILSECGKAVEKL